MTTIDHIFNQPIGTAPPPVDVPGKVLDLERLYAIALSKRCILEFGCGNSTLIMAKALPEKGRLYVVETSQEWADLVHNLLPPELRNRVEFLISPSTVTVHNGELCHQYDTLPDIVPDFIYLDGPDPQQVRGTCRGLTFNNRKVCSRDILLYEASLKKGCLILVDGRFNNCRFLERNLRRRWKMRRDERNSVEHFELIE